MKLQTKQLALDAAVVQTLITGMDLHIDALKTVIRFTDGDVTELRDVVLMFISRCTACGGTGFLKVPGRPDSGSLWETITQACEPCATARAAWERTAPIEEEDFQPEVPTKEVTL